MGWRDRDYARGTSGSFGENPLRWLLTGRVPLFELFDVRVSLHASFIVVALLVVLFGSPFGNTPQERVVFVALLFGIVLLHEFGHIFGARWSGGQGNDIEMTPLGGLAMAQPAKGPRSHLITIACGPLVNVLICLAVGLTLWLLTGYANVGPFSVGAISIETLEWYRPSLANPGFYLIQIYAISYYLLLFNLLPIYPLDGGQLLQGVIWLKTGYYKATLFTTSFGLVGSVLLGLWAIAIASLLMFFIMVMCFIACLQIRTMLKAEGPWAFSDQDEPDWMRSVNMDPDEPEKVGLLERHRQAKEVRRAEAEATAVAAREAELDAILVKIGKTGRDSLTRREQRVLEEATKARRSARS